MAFQWHSSVHWTSQCTLAQGRGMLTGFPRTICPRQRFSSIILTYFSPVRVADNLRFSSELYCTNFSELSRICEFCVILGIWRDYESVVRPAGQMITPKLSLRLGFDSIICTAPSCAGQTTPSQPSHYPLINMYLPLRISWITEETWSEMLFKHQFVSWDIENWCSLYNHDLNII